MDKFSANQAAFWASRLSMIKYSTIPSCQTVTVVNDFAGVEAPLSQVPLRGTSAGQRKFSGKLPIYELLGSLTGIVVLAVVVVAVVVVAVVVLVVVVLAVVVLVVVVLVVVVLVIVVLVVV